MPPQQQPSVHLWVGASPAPRMVGIQMLLGCVAVPENPRPLLPASLPSLKEQTLALLSGKERRMRLSWEGFRRGVVFWFCFPVFFFMRFIFFFIRKVELYQILIYTRIWVTFVSWVPVPLCLQNIDCSPYRLQGKAECSVSIKNNPTWSRNVPAAPQLCLGGASRDGLSGSGCCDGQI